MRFGDLVNRAKDVVDKRGGTDQLKRDAEQLKDIASGPGSAQDKAKRAADALKNPRGGAERPPQRPEEPGPRES
jgi:hypothetical protein